MFTHTEGDYFFPAIKRVPSSAASLCGNSVLLEYPTLPFIFILNFILLSFTPVVGFPGLNLATTGATLIYAEKTEKNLTDGKTD